MVCPIGSVTPTNAARYLGLENVFCTGGSRVALSQLVQSRKWNDIRDLARAAAKLG
ncbi:hypothetical protein GN278_01240 [Rhodobacteraceae bacterium Araon29]